MALLRDLATDLPLRHAVGGRVLCEGYFVTTTNGAVLQSEFPAGYSVARTGAGTYDVTVPAASQDMPYVQLVNAHSLHKVQVTAAVSGAVTLKTATLSVVCDDGPPVTATPVYTVADISGLVITFLLVSKE